MNNPIININTNIIDENKNSLWVADGTVFLKLHEEGGRVRDIGKLFWRNGNIVYFKAENATDGKLLKKDAIGFPKYMHNKVWYDVVIIKYLGLFHRLTWDDIEKLEYEKDKFVKKWNALYEMRLLISTKSWQTYR